MPLFFFNYTSDGAVCVDDVGAEFESLEAAYLDTCQSALAIGFEKLQARQDPMTDAFEILDDKQNVLMRVPMSEVLRPAARRTSMRLKRTFQACGRQIAESERLKAELKAEIASLRTSLGALRAIVVVSP